MNEIKTALLQEPEQDYIEAPGLTRGSIAQLLRCPAEYKAPTRPDSDAKSFGRALHCAALQPALFWSAWHAMSQSAATSAGKTEKACAVAAGKSILTCAEWDRLKSMKASLWTAYGGPGGLLDIQHGQAEASLYWPCVSPSGVVRQAKGRVDLLLPSGPDGRPLLIDVKTTSGGLSPDAVAHHIAQYSYHRQAAWYIDGYKAVARPEMEPRFVFVFIQSQPPYACRAVELVDEALQLARRECARALEILDACEAWGTWPTYADGGILQVDLPAWYKQRAEARLDCKALCI